MCFVLQVCLEEQWLATLRAECSVAMAMATVGVAEAGVRVVGDLEVGDHSVAVAGAASVDSIDSDFI